MRTILLILSALLLGCNHAPATKKVVKPDTRPSFLLDPAKPFVLELGRGSGLQGLDIIKVDQSGTLSMSRTTRSADTESTSLTLTRNDIAALADLVNTNQLTTMGQAYSDPSIADGTQWILWIQQGASEKAIYFNNSFPDQITTFASNLDALLQAAGSTAAKWTPLPKQQAADQQKALSSRLEPPRPPPQPH